MYPYPGFVALRYIHTRILFYSVVGGLAANSQYKTSKEPTSRASVAHVVKKRETRYDKEKARLKVVLFLSVAAAAAFLRSREKF